MTQIVVMLSLSLLPVTWCVCKRLSWRSLIRIWQPSWEGIASAALLSALPQALGEGSCYYGMKLLSKSLTSVLELTPSRPTLPSSSHVFSSSLLRSMDLLAQTSKMTSSTNLLRPSLPRTLDGLSPAISTKFIGLHTKIGTLATEAV
jgi:hypothetical protein